MCVRRRTFEGSAQYKRPNISIIVLHDMIVMACPLLSRNAKALQAHWISLVQRGPAPLHACICVSSSNAALLTGDLSETDPSKRWSNPLLVDTYHHRGETIRLVNDGLSDPVQAASDELIAAVSTLLTIEVCCFCLLWDVAC